MDSAKQLLALFREYNTDTLSFTDYFAIDDYETAIRKLPKPQSLAVSLI